MFIDYLISNFILKYHLFLKQAKRFLKSTLIIIVEIKYMYLPKLQVLIFLPKYISKEQKLSAKCFKT